MAGEGQEAVRARQALALELLREIYRAHADLCSGRPLACAPGCAVCCTDRVALTTLEGRLLAQGLARAGRSDLAAGVPGGWRPACTFNALARMCLAGQEPPAEAPAGPPGACPLLAGGLCLAYAERPLACRAMASHHTCLPGGAALQDPWWITLDAAFFQIVEHLDLGGGFGGLGQVLGALAGRGEGGLLVCEALPGLPAPPEHQERLNRLLPGLFSRPVRGRPLGLWMNEIRT